ncbi:MAG: PEP-CTERM sorting domain-containing protein, partial [Pirellulales bacterium]
VVWRRGLGTIYTQDDYVDWQTNFGQTAGSGSGSASLGAVPEPTSLGLLAVALLHFVCARRLRPRQ